MGRNKTLFVDDIIVYVDNNLKKLTKILLELKSNCDSPAEGYKVNIQKLTVFS